ncbi:MAG: hypothetical protein ACF8PN_08280 [Phycisphaerales bacterium]
MTGELSETGTRSPGGVEFDDEAARRRASRRRRVAWLSIASMSVATLVVLGSLAFRSARWTETARRHLEAMHEADGFFAEGSRGRGAPCMGVLVAEKYVPASVFLVEPDGRSANAIECHGVPLSHWASGDIPVNFPDLMIESTDRAKPLVTPGWEALGDFMLRPPLHPDAATVQAGPLVVGFSRPNPHAPQRRVVLYSDGTIERVDDWAAFVTITNAGNAARGEPPLPNWP